MPFEVRQYRQHPSAEVQQNAGLVLSEMVMNDQAIVPVTKTSSKHRSWWKGLASAVELATSLAQVQRFLSVVHTLVMLASS
jgi:hypothetical protein